MALYLHFALKKVNKTAPLIAFPKNKTSIIFHLVQVSLGVSIPTSNPGHSQALISLPLTIRPTLPSQFHFILTDCQVINKLKRWNWAD
mgnify:CR=1 FL=1